MDISARVGIMGGSFDPVHWGHIQIARLARDQLCLNKVLFLPAGDPPHKHRLAEKHHRLEMVRLALQGEKGFEVRPADSGLLDTRSIAEVSVGSGGKVSMKLYSKERALFKLYEMLSGEGDEEEGSLLEALREIGDK